MRKVLLWAGVPLFALGVAPGALAQVSAPTAVDRLIKDEQDSSLGVVTSVSQLSDVQPTDWAFQAVQSLVERYGCVAGYPDGTFRGNRAATRYELAALVNACLDNISDQFATQEDLAALRALQEEFAAELATLRGRVDGLEARTATLEAQQFSTTTKLEGSVILTAQFGDQINNAAPSPSRVSVLSEVGLTFNTSFTGEDLLQVALLTGNGGNDFFGDFFDTFGVNPAPLPAGLDGIVNLGAIEYRDTGTAVELDRLAYEFSPVKDLSLTVGAVVYPSDFIDGNSYANDPGVDFNSGFFINNALVINDAIDDPGGAGFGFNWNVNGGPVSLRGGYVASQADRAVDVGGQNGLFNDPHQAVFEVEYANAFAGGRNNFALRLQYAHIDSLAPAVEQNVLGVNAEATFGKFGIFGRYGISLDPQLANVDLFPANNNIQTWMAGIGIADLLVPGSMLSVAAGQPFIAPGAQPDQTNFEGFYRIPVNDNVTISPGVMVIVDPQNVNTNTLIQGVLRTTFSF
ncbi:iron uptake porin [Lyngbya confervoides]|uniref:Iron uptake porin n=1 Tax=Lyngbya confervoides BDU141951 TaxID=1574623 RepID=A0ABD4T0Y9_9CYAN|nr:iron uptake porin [Lyngbya confervoides]MCM1982076.1 iron uptake porin [Lyngbya confervoides BDU141951]